YSGHRGGDRRDADRRQPRAGSQLSEQKLSFSARVRRCGIAEQIIQGTAAVTVGTLIAASRAPVAS
ncbi:hypothetical protein CKJ90_31995, partial [Klebsiella pneumoniae]